MRRRVVVTGMGAINPMGHSVEELWQAMKNCESGVDYTTIFDASNFPSKISAEIKNWDISMAGEDPAKWKHAGRHTKFAVAAAKQAVDSSGILENGMSPTRLGVYLGAGEGDQDFFSFARMMTAALQGESLDLAELTRVGLETINPFMELEQEPNMPSGHVAGVFNAQGPNYNCLTACAASNQAIGEATELIRQGAADAIISGGTHSMIHPFGLTGFNLLTALSTNNDEPTKASRPFDRLRDGFVLGEGAAIIILEDLEHAKKRGAHIWGEIAGYGTTADAFRITDAHPDGRGAIGCMKLALDDAGVSPDQVDYINAHGTSTGVNDRVETVACKVMFGERAYQIPTSSTKSMMGHLIAAAGVTEAIICLLAIRDNLAPPTINYENPDPECDLDYVPNEPREAKIDLTLNNSFGFGGQNVTLALSRFTG